MKQRIITFVALLVLVSTCIAQEQPRLDSGKLRLCPDKPNCISSEIKGADSFVQPLVYSGSSVAVFNQLKSVLNIMGATILKEDEGYLAATFTSRIFRFVDDVEFRLDHDNTIIHVRSASRVGHSDWGVNRKRTEKIRNKFTERNTQYEKLAAEAGGIVKKFVGKMQPKLKAAIQSGGPVNAIKTCSIEAPGIALDFSNKTDWQVNRVSLKNRNNKTGMPDAWEKKVLLQFDLRQQKGESVQKMVFAEIVDNQFRYMKAQGVKPVCLGCHGEKLLPEVQATLQQHYPEDKATGYSLGQVRGAFSLSKEF